jgi:hypothetical protein
MIAPHFLMMASRSARGRLPKKPAGRRESWPYDELSAQSSVLFLRIFNMVYRNYQQFQIDIINIWLIAGKFCIELPCLPKV